MKTNIIKPSEMVLKEISKNLNIHTLTEPMLQNDNLKIQKNKFEWIFPIYELDTQTQETKIITDNNSWIVYDAERDLIYEFFSNGNFSKFYFNDDVSQEMMDTLIQMKNESKKAAFLRINILQLNFWWFGNEIPSLNLNDYFVLIGNNTSKFKKNQHYSLEEFIKKINNEVEFFNSRWYNTLNLK